MLDSDDKKRDLTELERAWETPGDTPAPSRRSYLTDSTRADGKVDVMETALREAGAEIPERASKNEIIEKLERAPQETIDQYNQEVKKEWKRREENCKDRKKRKMDPSELQGKIDSMEEEIKGIEEESERALTWGNRRGEVKAAAGRAIKKGLEEELETLKEAREEMESQ